MTDRYTVAVLTDIQGNVAALDAVLADLATQPHDPLVIAGWAQLGPRRAVSARMSFAPAPIVNAIVPRLCPLT